MIFFSHNKMCLRNKRLREVNLESHGFSMRKKKRSWFSLVKSLFVTEPNSKAQKVDLSLTPFNFFQLVSVLFCVVKDLLVFFLVSVSQKSKWWKWVFGGVRPENYPTLVSVSPQRLINKAREEQRKQAMAVAIATAAAAQAAMAAAKAAAEVVQLTGIPRSFQGYEKRIRNSAAIKIQAAYRAHLVSFLTILGSALALHFSTSSH